MNKAVIEKTFIAINTGKNSDGHLCISSILANLVTKTCTPSWYHTFSVSRADQRSEGYEVLCGFSATYWTYVCVYIYILRLPHKCIALLQVHHSVNALSPESQV